MTTFTLRIFIYGLIALAPNVSSGGWDVLLPQHLNHLAFVAFESGEYNGPETVRLNGLQHNVVPGLILSGQQITVPQLQPGMPSSPPPVSNKVPHSHSEGSSLSWLSTMSEILGTTEDPTINPHCLTGSTTTCPEALNARLLLHGGALNTCKLTELGDPSSLNIYSFQALPSLTTPAVEHALSVVLVFGVDLKAAQLTLRLEDFNPPHSSASITLNPIKCVDDQTKQCVDIIVGNTPPAVPNPDVNVASDFVVFYYMLSSGVPSPNLPLPTRNHNSSGPSSQGQPLCRSIESFLDLEPLGKVRATKKIRTHFDGKDKPANSPDSRPVCPMVLFG